MVSYKYCSGRGVLATVRYPSGGALRKLVKKIPNPAKNTTEFWKYHSLIGNRLLKVSCSTGFTSIRRIDGSKGQSHRKRQVRNDVSSSATGTGTSIPTTAETFRPI